MGEPVKIRKVVSTILIATMLFFAPSMVPLRAGAAVPFPCVSWLPTDTALAVAIIPCPQLRRRMDSFLLGFGPRSLVLLQSFFPAQWPTSVITGN
jgi:hypothetical protein